MHILELTPPEERVLGCLIEKRFTTPDQYPLTVNALRLACNQATNRDPVTRYDEATVSQAAQRLSKYGVVRLASGHTSRAAKFRHLAEEALGLDTEQLAVLCVLLLRGTQTPGEIKGRTERMVAFDSLEDVDRVLGELGEHGYVQRVERRPGQKEDRFMQLLGGAVEEPADAGASGSGAAGRAGGAVGAGGPGGTGGTGGAGDGAGAPAGAPAEDRSWRDLRANDDLAARVTELESQVAALREEIAALRLLWDDDAVDAG